MSVVYYPKVYFFYFCEEIVICAAFFDYRLQFEQSCMEGDLAHGGHAVKFDEVGMGASIDFDDGARAEDGMADAGACFHGCFVFVFLQEGGLPPSSWPRRQGAFLLPCRSSSWFSGRGRCPRSCRRGRPPEIPDPWRCALS